MEQYTPKQMALLLGSQSQARLQEYISDGLKIHMWKLTNTICKSFCEKAKRWCIHHMEKMWTFWHWRFQKRSQLSWPKNLFHYGARKEAQIAIPWSWYNKTWWQIYHQSVQKRHTHKQIHKLEFQLLRTKFNWNNEDSHFLSTQTLTMWSWTRQARRITISQKYLHLKWFSSTGCW